MNRQKTYGNDYVYGQLMPSVIDFPKTFLSTSKITLKSFNSCFETSVTVDTIVT